VFTLDRCRSPQGRFPASNKPIEISACYLLALSVSVGVLGGIWAFIALAPLAGFALVWAGFIAAGCFFAAGGDTIPVPALGTVWPAIVVGVTVFFLVIVASADVLSCVPVNVYGYAALVGYTLSAGKAASARKWMRRTLP
jgi:hypothetical protein